MLQFWGKRFSTYVARHSSAIKIHDFEVWNFYFSEESSSLFFRKAVEKFILQVDLL